MCIIITQDDIEKLNRNELIEKILPISGSLMTNMSIFNEDTIVGGGIDISTLSGYAIFVGRNPHGCPRIKVLKIKGKWDKSKAKKLRGGFSDHSQFNEVIIKSRTRITHLEYPPNNKPDRKFRLNKSDEQEICDFINRNIDILWRNNDDNISYSDADLKKDIISNEIKFYNANK